MTDMTYGMAVPANLTTAVKTAKAAKKPAAAPVSKSLFARIIDGMIEARRLQAETIFKNYLYGAY